MNNRSSLPDHERLLDEAIANLLRYKDKPPEELEEGMREVELCLVGLRDQLIDGYPRKERPPRVRDMLEQVNVALSLVIAVEYPVGSLERKKIAEAADVLKRLQREDRAQSA